MSKPLVPWNSPDETSHPQLVWRDKIDNRYLAEVRRISAYEGKFCVFDHNQNDKEIASWKISLSYGAPFGPDIEDVLKWQEKIIDFIDNIYSKQ